MWMDRGWVHLGGLGHRAAGQSFSEKSLSDATLGSGGVPASDEPLHYPTSSPVRIFVDESQ